MSSLTTEIELANADNAKGIITRHKSWESKK